MLYAIKLGPIETDEGRVHAYVGIREDGSLASPVLEYRDKDALRTLAARESPGETLLCEARLARAGQAFGFVAAEAPAWVPMPRAALATVLALGPAIMPGDPDALHMLFHGAAEFWRAKPWRHWSDADPIELVLTGAVERRFEAALMGAGGMEYGVALYPRAGALERIARRVDARRMHEAMREDTLAVTFDAEPKFAVTALKQAYGLARMPAPVRLERGGLVPLEGLDLAILGGTLRLLATVTPRHREASLEIEGGGQVVEIAVTMPPVVH
jgi:hypothetical protein